MVSKQIVNSPFLGVNVNAEDDMSIDTLTIYNRPAHKGKPTVINVKAFPTGIIIDAENVVLVPGVHDGKLVYMFVPRNS